MTGGAAAKSQKACGISVRGGMDERNLPVPSSQ